MPANRTQGCVRSCALLIQLRRCQKLRRATRFGGLFKCERQLDQSRLAPGAAKERNTHRQAANITRRHGDMRVTGDGLSRRVATGEMIAIDPVSGPCRPAGRRNQRVEFVLIHHKIDPLFA